MWWQTESTQVGGENRGDGASLDLGAGDAVANVSFIALQRVRTTLEHPQYVSNEQEQT
jgi:hypothetical protein